MRLHVPFDNVAELVYDPDPRCRLRSEVKEWFGDRPYRNWMNNPWEWFFDIDDLQLAMLFKLTWGGE